MIYNNYSKFKKYATSLVLGTVLVLSSIPNAEALVITRNFTGGTANANAVGAGNLQAIFNAAADSWESIISDNHALTINYSWAALGGGTLGVHNFGSGSGAPYRENTGTIRFDNDGSSVFYMDGDTTTNNEWSTFTETNADLGGGLMNTGRNYTGATGLAVGRFDLFSIVLHEIGHALGLSSGNAAFLAENGDLDIDVTSGAFNGATLGTQNGAHLSILSSLMYPFFGPGERTLISQADWAANCQISQFTQCADPAAVPEPGTAALLGIGLFGMILSRRRRKV